jgi:hypothetical protein
VITKGTGSTVKPNGFVAVCAAGVVESLTCTVKLRAPTTVGVPEIVPVEEFNVRPGGSVPELIDHVYAVVPPVADSDIE